MPRCVGSPSGEFLHSMAEKRARKMGEGELRECGLGWSVCSGIREEGSLTTESGLRGIVVGCRGASEFAPTGD